MKFIKKNVSKSFMSQKLISFLLIFFIIINFSLFLNYAMGESQDIKDVFELNKMPIELTEIEKNNPKCQSVLNKITKDNIAALNIEDFIIQNEGNKNLIIKPIDNSQQYQGTLVFTTETSNDSSNRGSNQKQPLTNFLKPLSTKISLTVTEIQDPDFREDRNKKQSVLNKVLKEGQNLSIDDVCITYTSSCHLVVASNEVSNKVKGRVIFNYIDINKNQIDFFLKDKETKIILTKAESQTPTQPILNKFLKTVNSLTITEDVTMSINVANNKVTITPEATSPKVEGNKVEFTNVVVKKDLSTFLNETTTKIILTQEEKNQISTQPILNKFLKTVNSLTITEDVTMSINVTNNKVTITPEATSPKVEGNKVEFTNVVVKKNLSTFLNETTTKIILTQEEKNQISTQPILNKFLKTVNSLTITEDVTMSIDDASKITITPKATSPKVEGNKVEFTNISVQTEESKQKLSTILQTKNLGELSERSIEAVRKALLNKFIPELTQKQEENLKIELIEGENQADISSSDFEGSVRVVFTVKSYIRLILFITIILLLTIIMFLMAVQIIKKIKNK
ncbi:variable membrane protein 1 [Candidatus Phytoplasma solani]